MTADAERRRQEAAFLGARTTKLQGTEGGTGNHRRPLSSLQPQWLSSGLNGVLERSEGSSSKAPELENLYPNAQRPNKQTKCMFSKTVVYTHD